MIMIRLPRTEPINAPHALENPVPEDQRRAAPPEPRRYDCGIGLVEKGDRMRTRMPFVHALTAAAGMLLLTAVSPLCAQIPQIPQI